MAMFDVVSKGFRDVRLRFEGKREITEENIDEALKDIRMSMLEADVNFRIAKNFIGRVKEKALGEIVKVRAKAGEKVEVTPAQSGDEYGDVVADVRHRPIPVIRKSRTPDCDGKAELPDDGQRRQHRAAAAEGPDPEVMAALERVGARAERRVGSRPCRRG